MSNKIQKIIQAILPGMFLLGYCIGTGSVTAMARAGADYGMSLLWTVAISCIITYYLIHLYGLFTIVSGETALAAIKKHLHPAIGIFLIVALGVNVSGSVMGVMGILSDVCYEWSKTFMTNGIAPLYFAVFFIALVYALFFHGGMKFFQNILVVLVMVMAIAFLFNFFILMPSLSEIGKGLIPNIPTTGIPNAANDKSAFLVIASMVGTTVFSGLFLMRGTLVKNAAWTTADIQMQKRDAMFSAGGMFIISMSIMGAAAGTLHVNGVEMTNVSEMITLLAPLAGLFAVYVFTLGLVAAGVSSQFPNVMLVPWLVDDYKERDQNMKRRQYRVFVLCISLLGLVVPIFNARPIVVMIASQAFGALILPITVASIFLLGNKVELMKRYVFTRTTNSLLILIFIFSLVMSYMSIIGLMSMIF